MKKILLSVLLSIFSTSCTSNIADQIDLVRYVDPSLRRLLNEFVRDAEKRGLEVPHLDKVVRIAYREHDYKASFFSMDTYAGVCATLFIKKDSLSDIYSFKNHYKEIMISEYYRDFYSTESYYALKSLMYHELGHCVYGLKHHPDTGHIMYFQVNGEVNSSNWNIKVNEFFDYAKKEGWE